MPTLRTLDEIAVPVPPADEIYRVRLFDHDYSFVGLKSLLAAADFSKAGDRGAGLAAPTEVVREAARSILSSLTLQHLYDRPLTDDEGQVDSVMRVSYDIDLARFQTISTWTVGQLKDFLLESPGYRIAPLGFALTSVMAAAVCKLMDVHDLVLAARKINRVSNARTTLGLPGTLSSRCQPNHPTDDLRGITLLVDLGLALGGGDALIGVNPAVDTVENIAAMLTHLDKIRRSTGAPTQICVLAHVKTQLGCLERGVPVEVMFQSLAGTEKTNLTEFDISVDLLDRAWKMMAEKGALAGIAENFMYFETGQGSEYTYGKHNGIDMTTCEALCYGLARRYRPFMVNNVTGFIGPETHVDNFEMIISNLQDHFMGKLLGLPMGMAPCYTLHSQITLDGQQMATQLLASAGANYYMDVYLNNDRMLAYFDTSAHDNQSLREVHGRTPTPEFLVWALERGIFTKNPGGGVVRGPNWGNPRIFCASDAEFDELLRVTPAMYGFDNAGPRPSNCVSRTLRANQALARQAIVAELDPGLLRQTADFLVLESEAHDKESHLNSPHLGARLSASSESQLEDVECDVQVVVSDGLSAEAVHANLGDLYPVLMDGLESRGLRLGRSLAVRYGRVKLAEHIAQCTGAALTILLIGERPGGDALASRSLSAYMAYQLVDETARMDAARFSGNAAIRFEYTVISNIYSGGLLPVEAGSVIVEKAWQILEKHAAGNRLEKML